MRDFFISYNQADKQWAEWIAWQLEEAGYSVFIQAWDFRAGGNFVLDMQRAAAESRKTIAVLSESYLKSSYTQPEWAAAFVRDPESLKRKLIPVLVEDCQPEGMLTSIVYVDLVGLTELKAKQTLLDSLRQRAKPEQAPAFPKAVPTKRLIEAPKVFPPAQQLINLLRPISLDKALKAYSFCLPEARPPGGDETLETLRSGLEDMPEGEDGLKPLLRFVMFLGQDESLSPDQQRALKTWAQAQGLPLENSSSNQKQVQPDRVETCLMLQVKRRLINDPSKGYLLSAMLVRDPNPFDQEDKCIKHRILISSQTNPKLPPAQELETILFELFQKCGAEHKVAITDLVVQLFLPKELMSLPIEHWQLPKGKQCCGQRCKAMLVRSSERYSLDYEWTEGDWKKYWNRFLDFPEAKCSNTLPILNPQEGNSYIQPHQSTVVGCRFVEHHHQQKQEEFWDDLLSQGLPIAFWLRRLGMTPEEVMAKATELEESALENCYIKRLSESLMEKRQELLPYLSKTKSELSQKEQLKQEQFKKAPFSLLWDNPFRPFPSIDYQS